MVDLWPKRTGADGEIHVMTVDEKLDILAESVKLLVQALRAHDLGYDSGFQEIAKLEGLWSDAK